MFPENELSAGLQQFPDFLHDGARVVDGTHDLNAQDCIHTALCHSFCPKDVAVLDTAHEKLVAGLESASLQLQGNVVIEVGVWIDGADGFNKIRIEAMNLVARTRAKLEDLASGLLDQGRNHSGAFILDKTLRW